MLEVAQDAFPEACFWDLSDVHKCLGGLLMAPSPLDKQTAGSTRLVDDLVMDLAFLCHNVEVKMVPVDAMWLFSVLA